LSLRGAWHRSNPGNPRKTAARTAIAATLVCAAGLAVAHAATDGFEAYTLESARRLAALRAPAAIPNLALDLVDVGRAGLPALLAQVLLVDFIYTRCPTYCAALGSVYAQLEQRLAPEIASGAVRLVSISFDPGRDGPGELRAYRARYSREARGWDIGRPADPRELRTWLDAFGVVVIPDELGGYTHNAAVHVVGPDRKLVAIHDLEDIDGTVNAARDILARTSQHAAAR
jgi:protein SCO1/2